MSAENRASREATSPYFKAAFSALRMMASAPSPCSNAPFTSRAASTGLKPSCCRAMTASDCGSTGAGTPRADGTAALPAPTPPSLSRSSSLLGVVHEQRHLAAQLGQVVDRAHRRFQLVAHALHVHDQPRRLLVDQRAPEAADHGCTLRVRDWGLGIGDWQETPRPGITLLRSSTAPFISIRSIRSSSLPVVPAPIGAALRIPNPESRIPTLTSSCPRPRARRRPGGRRWRERGRG